MTPKWPPGTLMILIPAYNEEGAVGDVVRDVRRLMPNAEVLVVDDCSLDNTLAVFVHEHAEANIHKASGMIALLAGSKDRLTTGRHTRVTGTVGDLYLTLTDGVLNAGLGKMPAATKQLPGVLV